LIFHPTTAKSCWQNSKRSRQKLYSKRKPNLKNKFKKNYTFDFGVTEL